MKHKSSAQRWLRLHKAPPDTQSRPLLPRARPSTSAAHPQAQHTCVPTASSTLQWTTACHPIMEPAPTSMGVCCGHHLAMWELQLSCSAAFGHPPLYATIVPAGGGNSLGGRGGASRGCGGCIRGRGGGCRLLRGGGGRLRMGGGGLGGLPRRAGGGGRLRRGGGRLPRRAGGGRVWVPAIPCPIWLAVAAFSLMPVSLTPSQVAASERLALAHKARTACCGGGGNGGSQLRSSCSRPSLRGPMQACPTCGTTATRTPHASRLHPAYTRHGTGMEGGTGRAGQAVVQPLHGSRRFWRRVRR